MTPSKRWALAYIIAGWILLTAGIGFACGILAYTFPVWVGLIMAVQLTSTALLGWNFPRAFKALA